MSQNVSATLLITAYLLFFTLFSVLSASVFLVWVTDLRSSFSKWPASYWAGTRTLGRVVKYWLLQAITLLVNVRILYLWNNKNKYLKGTRHDFNIFIEFACMFCTCLQRFSSRCPYQGFGSVGIQIRWSECSVCVLGCVCRSEAGVSGEKGQVSSAADECRSYISSRPPQTPEQWVSTSQYLHIAPSMLSQAAISLF